MKSTSRGAKHGPSKRQRMFYQAKTGAEKGPSEKARTPPNDTFTMVRQWKRTEIRWMPSCGEKNT